MQSKRIPRTSTRTRLPPGMFKTKNMSMTMTRSSPGMSRRILKMSTPMRLSLVMFKRTKKRKMTMMRLSLVTFRRKSTSTTMTSNLAIGECMPYNLL